MSIDTSTERAWRMAALLEGAGLSPGAAALLRALAAERDEWKERAEKVEEIVGFEPMDFLYWLDDDPEFGFTDLRELVDHFDHYDWQEPHCIQRAIRIGNTWIVASFDEDGFLTGVKEADEPAED